MVIYVAACALFFVEQDKLLVRNPFDNLSKIDAVHIPVFVTVGTDDGLTPPGKVQALFARANQPKRFYLVLAGWRVNSAPSSNH